jgi:hypothetical protein
MVFGGEEKVGGEIGEIGGKMRVFFLVVEMGKLWHLTGLGFFGI